MSVQDKTIYTLGHGNRELKSFLSLLLQYRIGTLVDIRAQPISEQFPHFDLEYLRQSLEEIGIAYHWAGRHLGGGREPLPESVHEALADPLLRGFADHMDGDQFFTGISQLKNLAYRSVVVILCAERDPTYCHRRLIADYLVLNGWTVLHVLDDQTPIEHILSPEARRESIQLIYDHVDNFED